MEEEDAEIFFLGFTWRIAAEQCGNAAAFNLNTLKHSIHNLMTTVYGEAGAAGLKIDILTYFASQKYCILRCSKTDYNKLKSCLPMKKEFGDKTFRLKLIRASPNFLSLLGSSRKLPHITSSRSEPRKRKLSELS